MIRKIENRLYKVNTYASSIILEVDNNYDEDVQELRQKLEFDCIGYKLNLLAKLAEMKILSVCVKSLETK